MTNLFSFTYNYFLQHFLKMRIKPRVLQMPITSRCNSRCLTCGIWKDHSEKIDLNPSSLKKALLDPFFSKVDTVGLNGGEPSLHPNIEGLLDTLFVLKHLKRIYFISNGLITHRLLDMMAVAKSRCETKGICVHLTVSIDGVNNVHNNVRGVPDAFEKTTSTLMAIKENQKKYCDVLDVGCTISKENIDYVIQTQQYLELLGVDAYYHPAVPNKRLHNYSQQDFSIMDDNHSRMLATEYFFGKFKYGKGFRTRIRSFLTYYYLLNHGQARMAGCNYLRSDVTITENLDLCLCAVASDIVGNLNESSASELLSSGKLRQEEIRLQRNCNECVHYIIFPSLKGLCKYFGELTKPFVWVKYKFLTIW